MTIAEQPASGRDEDPGDRALRTLAERAVKAARAELRGERAGILGVVGQSGLALQGRAKTVPDRWSVIHVMDRMEEAFRILGRLPLPTRPRGYINSMPTYLYTPTGVALDHPVASALLVSTSMDFGQITGSVATSDDFGTPALAVDIDVDLAAV